MHYSPAGEADFDDGKRGRVPGSKMPRLWGEEEEEKNARAVGSVYENPRS